MPDISIGFDPQSLRRIKNLMEWKIALEAHLFVAMGESVDVLEAAALGNMQRGFANRTGQLEDSLEKEVTAWQSKFFTEMPYAWRRERGFSGMTDSLGRFYPHDPGIEYMGDAVASSVAQIETIFIEQMEYALDAIGAL